MYKQSKLADASLVPNNFDLLRLIAAMQVVIVHLGDHFWQHEPLVIQVARFLPGVPIFFLISGFLISASWERYPDLQRYALNRFLRIFPAYWAAFALSLAGILLVYREPVLAQFSGQVALWSLSQLLMIPDWNPGFLRGYGDGVANGSLWTIPIELSFYVFVPILYQLFRKRERANLILTIVVALSFSIEYAAQFLGSNMPGGLVAYKLIGLTPFPWLGMFCVGILAQRNLSRILPILTGRAWLFGAIYAGVVALTASGHWPILLFGTSRYVSVINFAALALFTLALAYTNRGLAQRVLRRNDISYGLYLVHLPIMNALLAIGFTGLAGAALATLASVVLAIVIWTCIERPILATRDRPLYQRPNPGLV